MIVSLIVAASSNNVIGKDGGLPWRLPDDLKHFKEKTSGCPVIMGRKTYVSLPGGALPNRTNIVVTRDASFEAEGCTVVSSIDEAIAFAESSGAEEAFVIGGGEIYAQTIGRADIIYLTRVHTEIDGDVFFPEMDSTVWECIKSEEHAKDEKHAYAFTIEKYVRQG